MVNGTIHHIEIYVNDLKSTKAFWSWFLSKLNYKLFQDWDSGFSFKLGDTYIVFVQTEDRFRENSYHRCHAGLNHIAFHVATRKDVDTFTESVRKKGMKILYEDKHPYAGGIGYYALFFEDPNRIKVEIVANQ